MAALGLAVIVISYSVEAIARYAFNAPLNWSGDLSSYLLCTCVFLALPQITLHRQHIVMAFIPDRMDPVLRGFYLRVLAGLAAVTCAVTTGIIAIEGVRQFEHHILTSAVNQIPKWWLSALACFGLLGAAIHLLSETFGRDANSIADASQK